MARVPAKNPPMSTTRTSILSFVAIVSTTLPIDARAEKVLVEFTSVDGTVLVAQGDSKAPAADREATLKRIEARAAAIAKARMDLVASFSPALASRVYGDYVNLPLVRMDIDEADMIELSGHPQVVGVYPDRIVYPLMESSLAYLDADGWFADGYEGQGTAVAILDTGIRYWNGYFGDCDPVGGPDCRVKEFLGFAHLAFGSGETDPVVVATAEGHGTNVGGIVGDLAPGTDLLSLGVFAVYDPDSSSGFDGGALSNDGDVALAMDWCITNVETYNIVAANLSLGSSVDPNATGYCTGWMAGSYSAAFANARDAGIIPAVATGNDYVKTAVGPPSCVAAAMRVGAGYDDPAFGYTCGTGPVIPGAVTCFSNSSSLVDIIAPGNDIDAGGLYGYSGTSMATPHGAGIIALYASRFGTDPLWTMERIRADALTVQEIGPRQTYLHRYIRVGDRHAEVVWDTGAAFISTFTGTPIPDAGADGVELTVDVACESALCSSDVAGNVYLDLTVDTGRATDIAIELTNPEGTVASHAIDDPEELGIENINSILGSQHLAGVFSALRGGPIEGTWSLRVKDDASGELSTLYKAVLLVDSARLQLEGEILAPAVARPGEPFDVEVALTNTGNLDIEAAPLTLEMADSISGEVVDALEIFPTMPCVPGDGSVHEVELEGPQGHYELRLVAGDLVPDVGPGFSSEPAQVSITYRTFASFDVDPEVPTPMTEAQLTVTSRGMVDSHEWDFGDGITSTLPDPVHAWEMPGEYEVTLTVTGPDGASTTARTVTVAEPPLVVYGARGTGQACAIGTAGHGRVSWAAVLAGLLALGLALVRTATGSRRLASRIVAAAAALATVACDPGPVTTDGTTDVPEQGPWISLLDPPDPSMGDIDVFIMLSSGADATCDVLVEYRVGDGDFTAATLAEATASTGLAASAGGTEHMLPWETTTDIPRDAEDVQVRVQATCTGGDTLPVTSSPFLLINFLVTHPGAVIVTEISTAEETDMPADIQDPYVELANTTDTDLVLDGWRLVATGPDGRASEHALDGFTLPAGQRISLTGPAGEVPGALKLADDLPWSPVSGGAVALIATHERGTDFVRWGGSPTLPPLGLSWTDDPVLPIPQIHTVLVRADEAADLDLASDFCVGTPTPGQASTGCIARLDEGAVLVTELDTQGQYDKVEILNSTDGRVEMGGWILLWDGGDLGSGQMPIPSFGIDAGQRVVLQDNGLAGRFHAGILDLGQNLNIDGLIPTALGLQDPYGRVLDFVAAGGSLVRWLDWTDAGPTPMPGPDPSSAVPGPTLARRPGDPDTNSSADFCLTEDNMGTGATACLAPMGIELVITEVMPGRPDWVEIYNPGSDPVDLGDVYLSYTAPYYGGAVGDFLLSGTLEPGGLVVISERDIATVTGEIVVDENISLGSDGDGSVTLRDYHGFGIDFMMFGEPAGTPLWPDVWTGLGYDKYAEDSDDISIQRYPHDAADTDTRDDWCWAAPSPMAPNNPCS